MTIDKFITYFDNAKKSGDQYKAVCPCCNHKQHLYIGIGRNGNIVLNCQYCKAATEDIIAAAGLTMRDLLADGDEITEKIIKKPKQIEKREHLYRNEDGAVIAKKILVKFDNDKKNAYWQRCESGQWINGLKDKAGNIVLVAPPYNTDLLARTDGLVIISEGEKDADTTVKMGYTGTSIPNGGSQTKWYDDYNKHIKGRDVIILTDNDEVGEKYGEFVASHLEGVAKSIKVISAAAIAPNVRPKGDITDIADTIGIEAAKAALERAIANTGNIADTTAASKSFTLECLADIEESNQDFLFDPMIPIGQITALGGAGGVGKTNIICSVVAGVSNGNRSILGEINPDVGNRVVFFTSEDSIGKVIVKRLKRYKANLKNVFTIQLEDTEKFSKIKFDSPAIKEIIEEYKPTLMVFDPVQSFLPEHINMNSRADIRAALNPLIGYGQKYNVSFIILMHSNKKIGVSGRTRMADSAEFWDMCRCVLIVGEADRNGLKYISHEKTNYGKLADTILFTIEEGKVVSKGTTDKKDRDFIENEAKMVYEAPVKNKARDLIIEYLESVDGNSVEIKELDEMAKANSISTGTFRNAKAELKDEGVINISHTGFGKDTVWYCELVNKVS